MTHSPTGPEPDALNPVSLVTPRLVLSAGTRADAEALFPFVHGEVGRQVTDTLLWDGPDTVEDLDSFFQQHATGTFAGFGWHWLLRDRTGTLTGTALAPLGALGLTDSGTPGRFEIGYWLAPPYWGQRLMGEAISAAVSLAFEAAQCEQVTAEVFTSNRRGAALLDRQGFQREGVLPEHHLKRCRRIDAIAFVARRLTWRSG